MKDNNAPVAKNTDQVQSQPYIQPSIKKIYEDLPAELRDKIVVDVDVVMTGISFGKDGLEAIEKIESKISVSPCS